MMLNIVAVTLLAATGVQAQVLALQKEDYCFAAAKCYEKNSACATQYCSGPPGISACTVAGPFPFVPFNIPVRNQCCLTSNPYACYQAWAASHSGQTVDGSVVTSTITAVSTQLASLTTSTRVVVTSTPSASTTSSSSLASSSTASSVTQNAAPSGYGHTKVLIVGGLALAALF